MKYFTEHYKDAVYGSFDISHEAIDPQPNDPIVDKVVSIFEKMGFRSKDADPIKPRPSKNDIQSGLKEISKLLKERFGIIIHVLDSVDRMFCTLPLNFKITNVLTSDLKDIVPDLAETIDDESTKTDKELKSVYEEKDAYKMIKIWATNFKNAVMDSRLHKVSIDLKKAYINGVPEIYKSYILIDVDYAHSLNLTAREITAILFHEYGHNFTIVENTYRHIQNTTILLDSLRSEVGQKGKTVRAALKLTYEKIFNEPVSSSATTEQILVDWVEKEMKLTAFTTSNHAYTDTEALADQFPARFGLGPDIVSGLTKLYQGANNSSNGWFIPIVAIQGMLTSLLAINLYIGLMVHLGIGLLLNPVFLAIGSLTVWWLTSNIFFNRDFETGGILPYDTLYKRYQRVKLDLIRQIRTLEGVDSKFKNKLIEDVEEIEKHLKNVKLPSTSLLQKLVRIFSDNKRRAFDMKRSQQLMEELSENDLYVASGKLQQFV